MPTITPGKSILSLIALVTMIGPYLADWSETHVLNPNWPPHARFHNGQTMTTGLLLGLFTLYYLYIASPPSPSTSTATPTSTSLQHIRLQQTYLNFALLLQHLYYVPALSGSLYPGALWVDPEFGEGRPQLYVFSELLGAAWVGWWVEGRRLRGEMGGREKRM